MAGQELAGIDIAPWTAFLLLDALANMFNDEMLVYQARQMMDMLFRLGSETIFL
jgi:hypothetical protein